MTPYQQFKDRWKNGCGSCRCDRATSVVLCRGSVPADVLFVAEAPGASEDVLGQPLVGPAGIFLDRIIDEALEGFYPPPRRCFTNVVGCIPLGDDSGKMAEPDKEQIEACRPRLIQLIELVRPRLIVWVGSVAEKHGPKAVPPGRRIQTVDVTHPAAILRAVQAMQGLLRQRCVVRIRKAVERMLEDDQGGSRC